MKTQVLTALLGAMLLAPVSAQVETEAPKKQQKQEKKRARNKKRATKLEVGKTVPANLKLPTIDGKTTSFGDLRGKVVFVHFWSIRCPWEKYAEPVILGLEKKYKGKDVVILAINSNQNEIGAKPKAAKPAEDVEAGETKGADKKKKAAPYANLIAHVKKTEGFEHAVLVDHGNKASRMFGARTTPHCFVIDQKGVLRYSGGLDGYAQNRDNPEPFVKNAIDALLTGKEVTVANTRPYG